MSEFIRLRRVCRRDFCVGCPRRFGLIKFIVIVVNDEKYQMIVVDSLNC